MIEYVEIRDERAELIGILDTARSIIWHSIFFGVGDFELEAAATPDIIGLLTAGRYITRPDNDSVGIVETINIYDDIENGATIKASGRFFKSVLDRRIIYTLSGVVNRATILRGKVEEAVRAVVRDNAIQCAFDSRRNIPLLALGALAGFPALIVDENGEPAQKQVANANLLTYTDGVLEEYGLASKCILDGGKLLYTIYGGNDRSVTNEDGNDPVIFSREYDNLTASEYGYDTTTERNVALIGGEGEGVERFYTLLAHSASGLDRRELWIDAAGIKKKLKAGEVAEAFPQGTFAGTAFRVGGTIYATLEYTAEAKVQEYALASLLEKFPSGEFSGTTFTVDGVVYGNEIYGKEANYTLTATGYKAMLDADEKEGVYILTDAVYTALLKANGRQTLAGMYPAETFNGTLDATNGSYRYGRDFALGDIVTVQDQSVGRYVNVRIREVLEYQGENGYAVEVKYQ